MEKWKIKIKYCTLNTKIGYIENKTSDVSKLVICNAVNLEIGEVENKIPDDSKFVTNRALNTKIGELKIRLLIMTYDLGRMYFTGNDSLQNMFVYQPTLRMLQLQKYKVVNFVIRWKSKGIYSSNLSLQYTHFLHSIKCFGYKIVTKFDRDSLFAEQNSCKTKCLHCLQCKCLHCLLVKFLARKYACQFYIKTCLFGATNVVKNSDNDMWVYSGYGVAFDREGL